MSLTVDDYYKAISSERANNDEAVIAMAPDEPNGEASFASTPWTNYTLKIVPSNSKTRLIVFKPPKDHQKFGCIRVRDKNNTTLWDVVEKAEHYVGLVPAGCTFEAMTVEAKIFTRK